MKRIVHLIPFNGIGGVEVAARSLSTGCHGEIYFERHYLVQANETSVKPGEYHGPCISQNHPRAYWNALLRLYRDPPDLLVASLWRCALILIVLKLLRPRTKVVIFLHSAHDVHLYDKIFNRLAMHLSNAIWADSCKTLKRRVPSSLEGKTQIVSFLLSRRPVPNLRNPAPNFIFWGRLNRQKGLERAIKLFKGVLQFRDDARFTIIGPDGGIEEDLRVMISDLGLNDYVFFKGPMQHEDIARHSLDASFYLQTSLFEGMAMSVVEAMQGGLVPVVTPVGEIPRYCEDGKNAILVNNDSSAVDAILTLLSDTERYKLMSYRAAKYWQLQVLYRDDFISAAKKLVKDVGGTE